MNWAVEHLGLPALDPLGLKEWYVKVLGGRVLFASQEIPPSYFVALPGGGPLLELYAADRAIPDTGQNTVAGWRHVALRVESIEAGRIELESRGVRFLEPVKPAGGGGRVLFFADPEGNLWHLVERPPGTFAG